MLRAVALISLTVALLACSSAPKTPLTAVHCRDPRPSVCTMDYQPVCAQMDNGDWEVYSNPCNACSDSDVLGFNRGACPE